MKKLLLICPVILLTLGAMAQDKKEAHKDTTKKEIPLPAPVDPQAALKKPWYAIMTYAEWADLINMIRKSTYPSNVVDNTVTVLMERLKELNPPPAADTSKTKK